MIRLHRPNMDFRPVTSMNAVMAYISKYICKAETPSEMLKTLRKLVYSPFRPLQLQDPGVRLLQRYIMRDIQRDISAQEIDFFFLRNSLSECSRAFEYYSIHPTKSTISITRNGVRVQTSEWSLYLARPRCFENFSFVRMLREYTVNKQTGVWRRRASVALKKRIQCYFPELKRMQNEFFWKIRCLASIPCRSVTGCKANYSTWKARAEAARNFGGDLKIYPYEECPFSAAERENINEELPEIDDFVIPENSRPVYDSPVAEPNTGDLIDAVLTQADEINQVQEEQRMNNEFRLPTDALSIANTLKTFEPASFTLPPFRIENLNQRQRQAFRFCTQVLTDVHQNSLIIHGVGGTGKSHVIRSVLAWELARIGSLDGILVTAPAGQAAALLPKGQTIHSALGIQVPFSQFKELDSIEVGLMQARYRSSLKLLIIDEFSMVGSRILFAVDSRLRQIFPERRNEVFGGISVILLGDVGQLPPTADVPCFRRIMPTDGEAVLRRKLAFRSIGYAVILEEVMRTTNIELVTHLKKILTHSWEVEDLEFFKQRIEANLPISIREEFEDAITLCGSNKEANAINTEKLAALLGAVVRLHASDSDCEFPDTNTRNVAKMVELKVGANVMLLANKNVSCGLCNGSQGKVVGFTFPTDSRYPLVWVNFPGYTGPELIQGHPKVVPITHHKFIEEINNEDKIRFQTPLRLSYAITVHKSQGCSLEKFIFIPGKSEVAFGMSYVALSRATVLNSFMLRGLPVYPFERFDRMSKGTALNYIQEAEELFNHLYQR